jgi:membrane protein
MGAALAYYTALSFADVVAEFLALVGKAGGATVETILTHAADQKADRWTALLGFATLLAGASGVFVELQDSLNQIWEMPPRAWSWRILLHERLFSLAMVFVLGFLVLVSLIASAAISAVGGYLKAWLPGFDFLWESVNSVVSLVVITIMFAGLFRFLPEVKIAWGDVWTGAGLTSALFVLGKLPRGFYIGRSSFVSAYGAAGSLVIVLPWVFHSAKIFYFGAEFTRAFAPAPWKSPRYPVGWPSLMKVADDHARRDSARMSKMTNTTPKPPLG